jgi:hypothetical protein
VEQGTSKHRGPVADLFFHGEIYGGKIWNDVICGDLCGDLFFPAASLWRARCRCGEWVTDSSSATPTTGPGDGSDAWSKARGSIEDPSTTSSSMQRYMTLSHK